MPGVTCPSCSAATRVAETRSADGGRALRRRRHCLACGHRFTTFERPERGPLLIRKRNGSRQRFDRVKLRAALLGAAHKRPVTAPDVDRIVEKIEAAIEADGGEISAERIGELCLAELREIDHGAFLQYAGTLPSFNPEITASAEPVAATGSVRADSDPSSFRAEANEIGDEDD